MALRGGKRILAQRAAQKVRVAKGKMLPGHGEVVPPSRSQFRPDPPNLKHASPRTGGFREFGQDIKSVIPEKPIRKVAGGLGREAAHFGKPALKGALWGGAAIAGVGSAVLDRSGPYADLQEEHLGDREALRTTGKAAIASSMRGNRDRYGHNDFLYNRPVDGSVVFGMYNKRFV